MPSNPTLAVLQVLMITANSYMAAGSTNPSVSPSSPTMSPTVAPTHGPSDTDPGSRTVRVSMNGGDIAGTIILCIFYAVVLVFLAYWFYEPEVSIAKQLEELEAREAEAASPVSRQKPAEEMQDKLKALGEASPEEVAGEEWKKELKYDSKDRAGMRFKNWNQYVVTQKDLPTEGEARQQKLAELEAAFKALPTKEAQQEIDKWALLQIADDQKPWDQMTGFEKFEDVMVVFGKFIGIWCVLYLFIIALGLMGNAFKILGGRSSGKTFRENELFSNPIAGLVIGILITVLLQSSSTTTSVIISMSASGLIEVENAVFMIMGANIGTSVTNTIVSVFHINDPDEYRRAFTGATYHDMFNWCTVAVFLPLEACTGFLVNIAGAAVDNLDLEDNEKSEKVELLKKITKPAGGRIISVDKKLITKIAEAEDSEALAELEAKSIIKKSSGHVMRDTWMDDEEAGGLLLFVSLTMLCTCLLMLVKLLQSVLKGRVARMLRWLLNLDLDNAFCRLAGGLDNYILLIFGCGATILVQSSSVFTSAITPLVGIGLIHVQKLSALTMGANIGTTVTGVLSALAGDNMVVGMQVALCHVFFNCFGSFLWFVVWPLRPIPVYLAKGMGETAFKLKWFPAAYIIVCFGITPLIVLGICLAGGAVAAGVLVPLALLIISTMSLIYLRRNHPHLLSECLKGDPEWMPNWLKVVRDEAEDEVDIAAEKAKEAKRKKIEAQAGPNWEYSALVWSITILSFLCLLLALPTSQWRRVRYGVEYERNEIGFSASGQQVCSADFKKDAKWAPPPEVECTPVAIRDWLTRWNTSNDLIELCTARNGAGNFTDSFDWDGKKYFNKKSSDYWKKKAWAKSKAHATKASYKQASPYHKAWYDMRTHGCHAAEWEAGCLALSDVCTHTSHAQLCTEVSARAWIKRFPRSAFTYHYTDGKTLAWKAEEEHERREGEYCKNIDSWCPGDLNDDIAPLFGLAVTAELFLGIGIIAVVLTTMKGRDVKIEEVTDVNQPISAEQVEEALKMPRLFQKLIFVAAGTLTLSWVFMLAAWGRLAHLQDKTYSCPFLDESGRGAVMITDRLGNMTSQSYSWALCIIAWGFLTLTMPFVYGRMYTVLTTEQTNTEIPGDNEMQASEIPNEPVPALAPAAIQLDPPSARIDVEPAPREPEASTQP